MAELGLWAGQGLGALDVRRLCSRTGKHFDFMEIMRFQVIEAVLSPFVLARLFAESRKSGLLAGFFLCGPRSVFVVVAFSVFQGSVENKKIFSTGKSLVRHSSV